MIILSIILTYHAVLLPGLLLQHDDPVRGLVQGGGQTVPLSIQRLPNIKIVQFHEIKPCPAQRTATTKYQDCPQ